MPKCPLEEKNPLHTHHLADNLIFMYIDHFHNNVLSMSTKTLFAHPPESVINQAMILIHTLFAVQMKDGAVGLFVYHGTSHFLWLHILLFI